MVPLGDAAGRYRKVLNGAKWWCDLRVYSFSDYPNQNTQSREHQTEPSDCCLPTYLPADAQRLSVHGRLP